jgi:hypothetical protein
MLKFRIVFKLWPVILGAVLFGLGFRLTNGPAANDDPPPAKFELGGDVAVLKDQGGWLGHSSRE